MFEKVISDFRKKITKSTQSQTRAIEQQNLLTEEQRKPACLSKQTNQLEMDG
jgi:hypothetical protein